MSIIRQITLPFPEAALYPPESFVPGEANEAALAYLAAPGVWPHHRLAVWGLAGVGKTYFLHVAAQRLGGMLIHAGQLRAFQEPPAAAAIALDEADAAEPRALLHLLNWCAEQQRPLVFAARLAPSRYASGLADLDSRLRATLAAELRQPEDGLLAAQLRRHAIARQLRIEPEVEAYLLARLPRRGDALREAMARLDRMSLSRACPVTRPLAAEMLAGLTGQVGPSEDSDDSEIIETPLSAPSPSLPRLL